MTVEIRESRVSDAGAIARVKVDTWRSAYAGIVPDDYLASLSYDEPERRWTATLSERPPGAYEFVAADSEAGVVGFASAGPARAAELGYDGELYAIYVLEEHQGRHIGSELFRVVCAGFAAAGVRRMMLWMLDRNASRGFYERNGGKIIAEGEHEIGTTTLAKVAYGFELTNVSV